MKRITTWIPKCQCVVDLEWDDSIPEDRRVHTAVRISPCALHRDGKKLKEYVVRPAREFVIAGQTIRILEERRYLISHDPVRLARVLSVIATDSGAVAFK